VPPTRDDKVLADWNGLTIAALANAAFAFNRPKWLTAARQAYDFVRTQMQPTGQLRHSWCNGTSKHTALLDDYAYMARAALILYEQIPEPALLAQAETWVGVANTDYADRTGGYFLTAIQAEDVIVRTKSAADNATPPGNATMVEVLSRLAQITGTQSYADKAEASLKAFAGAMQAQPTNHTALIKAQEFHLNPTQITLVGDPADPATTALRDATRKIAFPARILTQYHPGQPLPRHHPAWSKTEAGIHPTAYVCRGRTCSLPLTDPAALTANLTVP
ncbi:MAG: thioredoxin domain-containing protein, partial [Alphaproteobacteria bacterium]